MAVRLIDDRQGRDDPVARRIRSLPKRFLSASINGLAAVWELRIDWGPGYRVYYALTGRDVVLLLCGGDKRKQAADISRAVRYWNDYNRRTGKS